MSLTLSPLDFVNAIFGDLRLIQPGLRFIGSKSCL